MAEIIRKAISGYNIVFDEMTAPTTKSWFLVAKPYECITILALYLMFVLKWGPSMMKNRKPFNLDKIMIAYNGIQVLCCSYVFVKGFQLAWGHKYRWVCEPVDFSDSEHTMQIARIVYVYYLLKIADLADTIFFVLRKKFNQLTFLHIYHHTGMVAIVWGATTYLPGGHGTMIGQLNAFVHCVMYSYYMLTVAVPSVKKSITFKKFVTQLQIIQFFLCIVHFGSICFKPDCAYPRWTAAVFLPQNVFMLVMFLDFYFKTYVKPYRKQELCGQNTDVDKKDDKMAEYVEVTPKGLNLNKDVQESLQSLIKCRSKKEKIC